MDWIAPGSESFVRKQQQLTLKFRETIIFKQVFYFLRDH